MVNDQFDEFIEMDPPEEESGIEEYDSVSDGDAIAPVYQLIPVNEAADPQLQELIEQMNTITRLMEAQEALSVDYQQRESMSIWEKPLEQYTVMESVTTLMFFMALVVVIFGMVGGIIKWRK